ncbi:MAG: glycoside hydrolase family 2 protein, partial [Flavobacteriales bacterium]
MVKYSYGSIPIILILLVGSFFAKGQTTYSITSNWVFKQGSKKDWIKAQVPGTVHTDLLANKLIDDPYYRTNEEKLQWIEREDWEYKTEIIPDQSLMNRKNIELVFEGLDTYAVVYLNGQKIIEADNMFRVWRANVKHLLRSGKNELKIHFPSVVNSLLPVYDSLKFKLPYRDNNPKNKYINNYVRKASYQFGWDWGPRFVTSGIWRPVYFQGWDQVKISDLFVKQKRLTAQKAELQAQLEIFSASAGLKVVEIT